MAKKEISKKHKQLSIEDFPGIELKTMDGVSQYSAIERMQNKALIADALWLCLVDNDVDSFKEILKRHLELTNKDDLAKKAGIPRRTLFRMLSPDGNPTLENVSKIIHQLCA